VIIGSYKTEVIGRRNWPTLEAVELATPTRVDGFNPKRLLGSIGNVPPAETEAACYQRSGEPAMAA
jgi:hypothetical protein